VAGWRKIYAWAEELPLNRKVEKPKAVKDNSLATQVAKLEIRLTKWETKAKRANNKIVSIKKEIAKMNKKIAKASASNHDALQALSPSEDLTKKFALLYRLTTNVCDALGNVVGYTGDEVKMQVEIPEGHKPMVQSENGTLMMVDWSEVEEA
jgi:type VI protein secretion system component VasK